MGAYKSYLIAVKDIKEVFSSVSIYGPMIGVPLFFSIVLPILTFYIAVYAAPSVVARITSLPIGTVSVANIKSLSFMYFFSINVLGPVFLTIPIFTASVIAADSFAGEKERRTSEVLLSMPVSTGDLLTGKLLASFIPTMLLTLAIFAIYGTIINMLSVSAFSAFILPTPTWLMMLATSPFLAIATIAIVVFVSSHVKGIKEAQQISTLLVLPILLMPFISILGIADLSVSFFAYLIVWLAIADIAIAYLSARSFSKESIL